MSLWSANEVPQSRMQQVYDEIKTPVKYGMVVAPTTNNYKIDCPTVFREGKMWYMTYLIYNGKSGRDGRGYETWLAESSDLLEWKTLGRVLSFKEEGWDNNQRGGYVSLIDNKWGGSYKVKKHKGKYWITYIGGDTPGYELGVLKVGVAYTDGKISEAHEWKTFNKPALSPQDSDNGWWESLTQYKSSVFEDKSKSLGKPFVMFYNAGGVNPQTKVKGERVGIALSDNMIDWTRYKGNPVINHEGGITGDAVIQKMDDLYVLFYFSAFRPGVNHKAFNSFMCSYDLINWTDWNGEKLIYPSESYDNQFAHKSCVIKHNGIVYHFYCAVNKDDQRGIALATSKPLGISKVRFPEPERTVFRSEISLNEGWKTCLEDSVWTNVNIPHNWDQYYGLRRLKHGNLHASAWYKRDFLSPENLNGKRAFLYFEGVGSYATVYLNGSKVGSHKGGRTTFTIDVTDYLKKGSGNSLVVRAEHPSMITDLPWVCGGCSNEWGFSEGSQPLGIFRPVTLVLTDEVRVEPFGVHLWNEEGSIKENNTEIQAVTTLKNYGKNPRQIELVSKLVDEDNVQVARSVDKLEILSGKTAEIKQVLTMEKRPQLWSPSSPYLYTLITMVKEDGKVIDEYKTPYGLRTISWPIYRNNGDNRFFINSQPLFINGTCEYEHMNGNTHSFSHKQIEARIDQIIAGGFNAFRDAHQPHNLLYKDLLDKKGLLQWTQFSAHVWYDSPAFRQNFKELLREWVIERRNSPSIVMWGLQNESSIPADFAKECVELIRELDPTTSRERLVTTCNGGEGTDWNVIQNWSGTYNTGIPEKYDEELSKDLLNGEYGAWRSIDLHTEGGFKMKGPLSEDRMNHLLEQKIRLAEKVSDRVCGQFQWIFSSHDNPGRLHFEEGYRELDRVGPFNYKGLLTSWGEPLDSYYMYRSNYAPASTSPMVYIVSHTWPDRWTEPGLKDTLIVYSNCDSVQLYNDVNSLPLGIRKNQGRGTHFQWDDVEIKYNVLHAVGYVNGIPVVNDLIILNHLPESPGFDKIYSTALYNEHINFKPVSTKGEKGYNYLYRINCGGNEYKDVNGQTWVSDKYLKKSDTKTWGSTSWASRFEGLHPVLGSQRQTYDPITGTKDWKLFQTFRYGAKELKYNFPVEPGEYLVEFYFAEPWYGTGGGLTCDNWRKFDVAINGNIVINDLDIWREAGHDGALKKTVKISTNKDILEISFPEIVSGQAIISAIAIASKNKTLKPAPSPQEDLAFISDSKSVIKNWLNTGEKLFLNTDISFSKLPPMLYGADFICSDITSGQKKYSIKAQNDIVLYLASPDMTKPSDFADTTLFAISNKSEKYALYSKHVKKGESIDVSISGSSVLISIPYIKEIVEVNERPDVRIEAEAAKLEGPVTKGKVFKDKDCIAIEQSGKVAVEFPVSPGLANVYMMRFRYINLSDKTLPIKIKLISEDGKILRDDIMLFPPFSEKWRVLSTTTDVFINAGNYRVRLESEDAKGLWLDSMDFQ